MKNLLFISLAVITLSACKDDNNSSFEILECGIDFNSTLHYLAIGDEWSSGIYLEEGEAWPNLIKSRLEEDGYVVTDFNSIGSVGVNSEQLSVNLAADESRKCHNVITLMVGTQDLLAGRSPEQFRLSYRSLIAECRAITGETASDTASVSCVGLPNFSLAAGLPTTAGTPAEVAQLIQAYNVVIAEECATAKVRFADIFPVSTNLYQNNNVTPEDSLHANATQHAVWSNIILEMVVAGI